MLGPEQVFPYREAGRIAHRSWRIDLDAALRFFPAFPGNQARLAREAEEMARHFPRWLLTLGLGRDRALCRSCGGLLVFDDGVRCVACQKKATLSSLAKAQLAWFGLLPPIGIDGLPKIRESLVARPPPLHRVGQQPDTGTFILTPLLATYPPSFPEYQVSIAYLPGFFEIPGVPADAPSHQVHLLGSGRMCLFAAGEWRATMTCREVLQQRAYAHAIKLLNFANGKRTAFAIVS